jgi:hypothetical protein
MRTIGIITTWLVGLAVVIAVAVGVRSKSDVQRYLKIRQM